VDFERMQPCLAIYAKAAARAGSGEQAMLEEMFAATQLTRGSITDQEIRRTAVRLAAGGADPKVSEAIRKQQDAELALSNLLRERDALGENPSDNAGKARLAELEKEIPAARSALADADGVVQAAAPNYQQLIQQPVKPEDVFAALRPSEAFVSITLADTGGWTFVLRDHRIAVAPVKGGQAEMAALVKRLRKSIEPGDDNRVPQYDVAAARELYDRTLGGVAEAIEGAKLLTVAPTGPLLSIPFEVLLTGPADTNNLGAAPFLVRKFVIAHVPAAANFVKLRQAMASKAPRPWLGFGDFRPITQAQALKTYPGARCRQSAEVLAGLPRLEGTQRELGLVSRVFGAAPGETVTGPAFTVSAVKKEPLSQYRIVHFATHALLPAEIACQEEPAIVTSTPDGAPDAAGALLTSAEISGLKMDADAVVLSACNSGGPGGTTAGESLAGLARSFFYAGARSLLVTHWTVEDEFATYLVALSLNSLKEHPSEGLAVALQRAQITFLDRTDIEAPLKHPYYWAPFALVGEGGARTLSADNQVSPRDRAGL
jgi:CHAT domain-containing protein